MRNSSTRHAYYRKKAKKVFRMIPRGAGNEGRAFSFLRRISPYVFEELVLDAFERAGCRVQRNRRYSGDGGVDGRFSLHGEMYLVQCKRYRKYINPQHVSDFSKLCVQQGKKGVFVHTGKTGKMARSVLKEQYGCVQIVSGKRLLSLLSGTPLPELFARPSGK